MAKDRVAVLLTESSRARVMPEESLLRLSDVAELREAAGPPQEWDLTELLDGAVACLTGWGTPSLTDAVLAACPDLKLVAHTAGSIRALVPADAIGERIRVCQAAALIADAVAEFTVLQMLEGLRRLHDADRRLRGGDEWREVVDAIPGHLLGAQTVGVVGASRVGRAVIRLVQAFSSEIMVHDPYLSADDASALHVQAVDLQTLLRRSDVVTLHAPFIPATANMIGSKELHLMRDGALLINCARAGLIDPDALLAELKAGRLWAALDVFPSEPLAPDSEWRQVPNTIISPHLAGRTVETYHRQGDAIVADVERFLRGEPLRHEIDPSTAANLA
jgi:phosphoglycerate dehydrogenase-like enzyme